MLKKNLQLPENNTRKQTKITYNDKLIVPLNVTNIYGNILKDQLQTLQNNNNYQQRTPQRQKYANTTIAVINQNILPIQQHIQWIDKRISNGIVFVCHASWQL